MNNLTEAIARLHVLRQHEQHLADQYREAKAAFEAATQDLKAERDMAVAQREEQDRAVRALAIDAFAETGERKPSKGVEVVDSTWHEYDHDYAMEWALKANVALRLDDKALKRFLPALVEEGVEWAWERKDFAVRIASDLSAAHRAAMATADGLDEAIP